MLMCLCHFIIYDFNDDTNVPWLNYMFYLHFFLLVTDFSFWTGSRRHQQEHSWNNIPLQLAEEAISSVQNRPHPQGSQHPENHYQIRRIQRLHKSKGHETPQETPTLHSRWQRATQVSLHLLCVFSRPKRVLQLVQLRSAVQRLQHNQARVQGYRRKRYLDNGNEWEGSRQGLCGWEWREESNAGLSGYSRKGEEECRRRHGGVWFGCRGCWGLFQFGWVGCVQPKSHFALLCCNL